MRRRGVRQRRQLPSIRSSPELIKAQCQRRRSFPIRVRNLRGGERAVSAAISVDGRRAKVVQGERLRSRVVLAGLPKGAHEVRIVTRTNRGRTSTEIRRYRTCVPRSTRR